VFDTSERSVLNLE